MKHDNWPGWLNRKCGEWVRKRSGSSWRGQIVGWYSTRQTNIGYVIESYYEPNSVQLFPEAALEDWKDHP